MTRIIKVVKLSTPNETRNSLKNIVSQLETNNYAISSDMGAVRLFGRFVPKKYKQMLIISRPSSRQKGISIITVEPSFIIEKCGDYSFKIRAK